MFESSAARIKHLQRVTNTRSLKRCLVDLYRSFLCISLYFQKVCLIILSNFNYDQLFLQTKFVVSHSTAPGTHLRHSAPSTRHQEIVPLHRVLEIGNSTITNNITRFSDSLFLIFDGKRSRIVLNLL